MTQVNVGICKDVGWPQCPNGLFSVPEHIVNTSPTSGGAAGQKSPLQREKIRSRQNLGKEGSSTGLSAAEVKSRQRG